MIGLERLVLRAAISMGEKTLADRVGRDISTISKWVSDKQGIPLPMVEPLIEACGLTVVPDGYVVIEKREHDALVELASLWINSKAKKA